MEVKHNIKKEAYIELAGKILNEDKGLNEDMFSDFVRPSDFLCINDDNLCSEEVDKVGIWKKVANESFYERDISLKPEWEFWSGTHRIDVESDKKRIVYLGESAARGMFYDPSYCPAKLLENMLNLSNSKSDTYEVVDLARTNMDYEQLQVITNESLKLSPDGVVVFAGNNWIYSAQRSLSHEDLFSIYNAESSARSRRLEEVMVKKIKTITRQYLEVLSKIQTELGIPVFFMLPEFNLLDWKSSKIEKVISAMPEEKLEEWLVHRQVVELEKSSDDVKKSAEQMIGLDATNPIGFEALADCLIKVGDYEGALGVLEKSKDTNVFGRSASKPRTHRAVSDVLRNITTDVKVIDLPTVFREKNLLPNREIFLDYCHMTEKGIKVAMAEIGSSILSELSKENINVDDVTFDYEPTDEVRGNALVNAAIHNAHYGQDHQVLFYLCSEAANISPKSVEFIRAYVDMATRKASTTLCKGHEEIIEKGFAEQYGGTGILHKAKEKLMDIKLVDSMAEALSQLGEGDRQHIDMLRVKNYGVKQKEVNLLESFYSRDSYDHFQLQRVNYFQSRDYKSEFFVIAEAVKNLKFKLTFRTPLVALENTYITITLNDQFISKVKSKKQWFSCEFEIDASLQAKGVNVLKIEWPTKVGRQERSINENRGIGQDVILGELYPVFGEIHALSVKTIE